MFVYVQSGSWLYNQFKQLREQIRYINLVKGSSDLKFSYSEKFEIILTVWRKISSQEESSPLRGFRADSYIQISRNEPLQRNLWKTRLI